MNNLFCKFILWLNYQVWLIYINYKKREADRKDKKFNRQFHVIRVNNGRLKCVDNSFVKIYNANSKKKINAIILRSLAIYSTRMKK